MTRIQPLNDRILIKDLPKEGERKLESGIYIPESATPDTQTAFGEVVEVGHGKYNEKGEKLRDLNVKVGDKVIYGKYAGSEVELDREIYKLMIEEDILGIVK